MSSPKLTDLKHGDSLLWSHFPLPRANSKSIAIGFSLIFLAGISAFAVRNFASNPHFKEVSPKYGDLTSSIVTSGRIQPDNRVDIKSPIPGRADKILVKEGDTVKKGQILMWVSSVQRAAIIDSARLMSDSEVAHWEKTNPATPVVAPLDGLVIQRNIEHGQTFGNEDAILVLSDRFVVEAAIDETDVARVKVGQKVRTILDAYPNETLDSKVLRISHEATNQSNVITYKMEIEITEVPDFVRVGMNANVSFDIESKKNVLLVPSEALKAEADELYLLVGKPGSDAPKKRVVEIGLSNGQMTEITSGIGPSDLVFIPTENPLKKQPQKKKRSIF